jgi:peptide deformylase
VEIVTYPAEILERPAAPITSIDDEVRARVARMFEIMYAARGVGLAAPQVDWSVQLFVIDPHCDPEKGQPQVFINPELLAQRGRVIDEEGCLSFPGLRFDVPRARWIRMRAQDLEGRTLEFETDHPLISRILQHEYDHLQGVLYITRMMPATRSSVEVQRRLRELRERAATA